MTPLTDGASVPWWPPEDRNASIWRYVSGAKLLSLLHSRQLFMPNIRTLDDQREGHPPGDFLSLQREAIVRNGGDADDVINNQTRLQELFRSMCYVSCWHRNESESELMWHRYAVADSGVAIKSTVHKLLEATGLESIAGFQHSMVRYVDAIDDIEAEPYNLLAWAFTKRKPFQGDAEYRAVVLNADAQSVGIAIALQFDVLVEDLVAAPFMPPWHLNALQGVLDKYEQPIRLRRSVLAD